LVGDMTTPKLFAFAFIALLAFDYTSNNNRLLEALSSQATQLGYWLSNELFQIERRIAPFR
jgi:hypothetical protein